MLVCVGIALRIAHWSPGIASDDSDYMNNAAQLAVGKPPLAANQHSVRLGYEVFLAAGMRIFGQNTKVCQALGLGVFAVTALLLFLLAGMLSAAGRQCWLCSCMSSCRWICC